MAYNTPIKIVVLVSKVHARALDSVNTSAVTKNATVSYFLLC